MKNLTAFFFLVLFSYCKEKPIPIIENDNKTNENVLNSYYDFGDSKDIDSFWVDFRPEIRDSIIKIEDNYFSSGIVGINGAKDKAYNTRRWIYKNGTIEEFEKLKTATIPSIKAIAYESLFYKQKDKRYELLIEASKDTSSFFYYQSGCIGRPYLISEYLFEVRLNFNYYKENSYDSQIEKYFSKEEFLELMKIYKEIELKKDVYYKASSIYWDLKIE